MAKPITFSKKLSISLAIEPKEIVDFSEKAFSLLRQKIEKKLIVSKLDKKQYAVMKVEKILSIGHPLAHQEKLYVPIEYQAEVGSPEKGDIYKAKIDGIFPQLTTALINLTPIRIAVSNFPPDYKASANMITNGIHSFHLNQEMTFRITGVIVQKPANSTSSEFRCTAEPFIQVVEQKFQDAVMEPSG